MKLDLVKLRSMWDQVDKQRKEYEEAANFGRFCKRCGETNPEGGFYPTFNYMIGDLSGLLCNQCDKESRVVHTVADSK